MPITVDTTATTGDIDVMTTNIGVLFQGIFDFLVTIAPLILLVLAGWIGYGIIRRLVRART